MEGVRDVEDDLGVFLGGSGFEGDGAVGVQELVGDVGLDGGAAGRDAAFGDEGEEAAEELADVGASGELGEFGEEIGGKIFRVVVDGHRDEGRGVSRGVAAAKTGVVRQAGETAALAVGMEIRTASGSSLHRTCDGIGGGA